MPGRVTNLIDFSGGYATDSPSDLLPGNMLLTAENIFWREGLLKRQGKVAWGESGISGITGIRGHIRVFMNSKWFTILAIDDNTDTRLYSDYTTAKTFVEIASPAAYTLTKGYEVEMDFLDGQVVGVDGIDQDPFVVYYDGGMQITTLDIIDTRTRDDDDWYAGQYDVSEANPYIDDTTDAQSSTVDDFQLASITNGDGFYMAGVVTFNKFIMKGAPQFDGVPVAVYEYYNGTTWTALTMVTTPSWTAAAGDKTFEFDFPQAWAVWDGANALDAIGGSEVTGSLTGRYVIRVRFTTAPTSAQVTDYFEVSHTQYVTQTFRGDIPQHVVTYAETIFISSGIITNFSERNSITGWEAWKAEYFKAGGEEILKMVPFNEQLLFTKAGAIHTLIGNYYDNWTNRLVCNVGTISGDSVVMTSQVVFFIGSDKYVYAFNGQYEKRVSKHIQSDIDGYTLTDANSYIYENDVFISFPTDSIILRFDPDTFRTDDLGDGRVSFWKYTGISAKKVIRYNEENDTGELIAVSGTAMIEMENGNYYDEADTVIAVDFLTKELAFNSFQVLKKYVRAKPEVAIAGDWTFTIYADHQSVNAAITLSSGAGSGRYNEDVSIPYTLDGKNLAFRLQNNTVNNAKIYGLAVDYKRRKY